MLLLLIYRGYFGTPECLAPKTGVAEIEEAAPADWGTLPNFLQCNTLRDGQSQSPIEVPPGVDFVDSLRYMIHYVFPNPLECTAQSCKITNTGYSMRVGPFPFEEKHMMKIDKIFDNPIFDDKHYVLDHIEFKWGQVKFL